MSVFQSVFLSKDVPSRRCLLLVEDKLRLDFHLDEGLNHWVVYVFVDQVKNLLWLEVLPFGLEVLDHVVSVVQPHAVGATRHAAQVGSRRVGGLWGVSLARYVPVNTCSHFKHE